MKLVSLLLSFTVVSVSVSARHSDLDTDLASAGYRPGVAVLPEHPGKFAGRPLVGRTASFATTRQMTLDLASAGYGPAGEASIPAVDHVAPEGRLRALVDHRTSDAIRTDLASAGYARLPAPRVVLIASPQN